MTGQVWAKVDEKGFVSLVKDNDLSWYAAYGFSLLNETPPTKTQISIAVWIGIISGAILGFIAGVIV